MTVCAIVPLRDGRLGKTRLAPVLDAAGREALLAGMLGRVLDVLQGSRAVDEIVVVTGDPALDVAGVRTVFDGGRGLNHAVRLGLEAPLRRAL